MANTATLTSVPAQLTTHQQTHTIPNEPRTHCVEQVAAVMGPSGAGKTTFLNALMGTVKYGSISGQVWVNGRAMKMSRLRRIMGFVPQVITTMTTIIMNENACQPGLGRCGAIMRMLMTQSTQITKLTVTMCVSECQVCTKANSFAGSICHFSD